MPFAYFPYETIEDVLDVVITLVGYDAPMRAALLAGVPPKFKALMPGGQAPPIGSLKVDLDFLNRTERLLDGTIPLRIFLKNAISLAGDVETADLLRKLLDQLVSTTSGAPRVDLASVPERKEAIVGTDDMLPHGFMAGGISASRGVAKLTIPRFEAGKSIMQGAQPVLYLGTGWLIAPDLLITNHHVIAARVEGEPSPSIQDLNLQAAAMQVLFDYDNQNAQGTAVSVTDLVASDALLDYAVLRIPLPNARAPLSCASQRIANVSASHPLAVNIIQHPDGRPKQFAIRNNLVTATLPEELRYFTDTLPGSSGSPVFNDRWEVVALHRGSTYVRGVKFNGRDVAYVNIGTPIAAILAHLQRTRPGLLP